RPAAVGAGAPDRPAAARAPRLEVAGRGVAAAAAPPPDLSPWRPARPERPARPGHAAWPGAWSASRRCCPRRGVSCWRLDADAVTPATALRVGTALRAEYPAELVAA